MTSTLYLTRNGLLEPLGKSQVLSYLRGLSKEYQITLITFEKEEDWLDINSMTNQRAECDSLGIRWLPQRFRSKPKLVAPALSMLFMAWLLIREAKLQQSTLIHARSYLPATVALVVGKLLGIPFIFDMRALWPEELITAGRLHRGSLMHRVLTAAESACLKHAAAVVSLTEAAVVHLRGGFPDKLQNQIFVVIPTCVDLQRFTPLKQTSIHYSIGCLGTLLSGWFRLDWLAAFLKVVAERNPTIRFELTTRDNPDLVRAAIGGNADLQSRLVIKPSCSDQVSSILQGQMASVMFFVPGLGKLGSCPTRMAEILACGLPVVANEGVGDVAQIIRAHRVGVLVTGQTDNEMNNAWDELEELFQDPKLVLRCRQVAEKIFSLEKGTAAYAALYKQILNKSKQEKRSIN